MTAPVTMTEKPKRSRKKKAVEVTAPAAPTKCAQCGKTFDYRDRIYNCAIHGLCNKCRQRQNKFLLKGQYQIITVKDKAGYDAEDDEGNPIRVRNIFQGTKRADRRAKANFDERIRKALDHNDIQEAERLHRIARSKGLVTDAPTRVHVHSHIDD